MGKRFCKKRKSEKKDLYAVAAIRDGNTVGHVPWKMSAVLFSVSPERRVFTLQCHWRSVFLSLEHRGG